MREGKKIPRIHGCHGQVSAEEASRPLATGVGELITPTAVNLFD
jgi:hypothetical protein